MSRIGRNPIVIPAGVEFKCENNLVTVKGPLGTLTQQINSRAITFKIEDGRIIVENASTDKVEKGKHGLYRALVNNMVEGVTKGFSKSLILSAVGCKCNIQGGKISLLLGYSHPVVHVIPEGITVTSTDPKDNKLTIEVKGISKEKVGHFAAAIKDSRKFDPYHGYGLRYSNVPWIKKEGKTAGK